MRTTLPNRDRAPKRKVAELPISPCKNEPKGQKYLIPQVLENTAIIIIIIIIIITVYSQYIHIIGCGSSSVKAYNTNFNMSLISTIYNNGLKKKKKRKFYRKIYT